MDSLKAKQYHINWEYEDPATPALVVPMFDDMGLAEGEDESLHALEARDATLQYCLTEIQNGRENEYYWRMGDLEEKAWIFYGGYLACLDKHFGVQGR